MKMQSSRSLMALCRSTATTDESTPPAQSQQHFAVFHLVFNALDRIISQRFHFPQRLAFADIKKKILKDYLDAFLGVDHLRVKLQAVNLVDGVFHGRHRGVVGKCRGLEPVRQFGDAVTMAHPYHRFAVDILEEVRECLDHQLSPAELAFPGGVDHALQQAGDQLHAIADAPVPERPS